MSLGGRPKEEGGHKPLKISVDDFVYNALNKVRNKSKFIEKSIRPILKQFDPGEACKTLTKIDKMISQEIIKATEERNYDQVAALVALYNSFGDYRELCSPSKVDPVSVGGGITVIKGNESTTTRYGLTINIDNESEREIVRRLGRALINSWLNEKVIEKRNF